MPRQSRISLAAAFTAAAFVMADTAAAQHVVFAPDTDPEYRQQVLDSIAQRRARLGSAQRFSVGERWPDGAVQGDPVGISWSIVPDNTGPIPKLPDNFFETPGASEMFLTLDGKFGGRDTWLAILTEAFQQTAPPDGSVNSWGNISGITFVQVTGPPEPDPLNPGEFISVDWDTGDTWDDTGSINGLLAAPGLGGLPPADPLNPGVGDIRFAMKRVDNFGGVLAYAFPPDDPDFPGEIVLDLAEPWEDDAINFRFMRNTVAQMIGFAVGLEIACPTQGLRLMEDASGQAFTGPQLDDVRGIQRLYGDYLEINDDRAIPGATIIDVNVVEALLGQFNIFDNVSLDSPTDEDVFVVRFPDLGLEEYQFDVIVKADPIGATYEDGPATDGACAGEFDEINALAMRDLRIAILDQTLMPVDGFDCDSENPVVPLIPDGAGFINEKVVGTFECVKVLIDQPGDYYFVIGGSPFNGGPADQPQLYSVTFQIGDLIFNDGISFDSVCLPLAPNGLGANRLSNIEGSLPGPLPGEQTFRGKMARIGIVEDVHPSLGHDTTKFINDPPPLISQDFPPRRIAWPGNALAPAALDGVSSHATAVAACAIGNPVGVFPSGFVGPAPEASWLSASIGVRSFGSGGFSTSDEALIYGLFGLADPDTALALGLPTTATVLNNSWGSLGDTRGDSNISHIFEALVYMTGVPVVVSSGNAGFVDNIPECGGGSGNTPGSLFRGSRTIGSPASAFNTIAVGSAGKVLGEGTPPLPEAVAPLATPYGLVVDSSSKGPLDAFDFESSAFQPNQRTGLDLVSIGSGFVIEGTDPLEQDPPGDTCNYRGHPTAVLLSLPDLGNSADPDNPDDPERFRAQSGTSFAAPAVAGGIALLQDYALAQVPPIDLRSMVIRAIMLTSARKFDGSSNSDTGVPAEPQDNRQGADPINDDGTVSRQSNVLTLDSAQGAGFADIKRSYEVLRGRYDKDTLVGLVTGAPSTNMSITDPAVSTVYTPPNELEFITPIPTGISAPTSVEQLPPSPIEIADKLRKARQGLPENPILRIQGDFGDPDLEQVGGGKSAEGISFESRVPFKLPPNPNRPNVVAPDVPVEIAPENLIVVNPIGWDHAKLGQRVFNMPPGQGSNNFQGGPLRGGYIDYFIAYAFDGLGDYITATLCWDRAVEMDIPDFSDIDNPLIGEIETLELDNLSLELIATSATGAILGDHFDLGVIDSDPFGSIWAFSRSGYSTVEHIHTRTLERAADDDDELPPPGFYTLRVSWTTGFSAGDGQIYDLFNNSAPGDVEYALAWRVEPTEGSDPDIDDPPPLVAASSRPQSQAMKVLRMYLDAFGKSDTDPDFNRAFDVNNDNRVDVHDFAPIYRFWFTR